MKIPRGGDNGFTLVEIILAITVLGILGGVMANAIGYYNGLGRKTYQVLLHQNELQNIINHILEGSGDVPGLVVAKEFTIDDITDPCDLDEAGHGGYGGTLEFTLPDDTEKTYRYDADEGKLYLKVGAGAETVLMENLTCFSVKDKDDDGKIALIRLRTTVSGTGGDRIVELATQVKPRNVP